MAGDTPDEAVHAYLERLGRAVSCVTPVWLHALGYAVSDEPDSVSFGDTPGRELGDPVPLRTRHGRRGLLFSVAQWYVVRHFPEDPSVPDADRRGPYKVSTTSYDYSILDEHEHELLAWQWDPRGKGTKPFPHLHIGAGVGAVHLGEMVEPLPVDKMHIPTGRVLVEDVIRSIIEEMGVEPLRSDWDTILRDNTEAFRRGRTW